VSTRAIPRMVTAFCAGDGKKPYATRQQAYYAIAKDMVVAKYPTVVAKYPTGLNSAEDGEQAYRDRSVDLVLVRTAKSFRLFWSHDPSDTIPLYFDTKRWVAFVRRLAKYLEYVDRRDGNAIGELDTPTLEDRFQYAENSSVKWGELAEVCRAELRRRGNS
jgi:hypothetical protein